MGDERTALSRYTTRIIGYVPVYRFVREDEEQEFVVYRCPLSDEALMSFGIGDVDEVALAALSEYAAQMDETLDEIDGI